MLQAWESERPRRPLRSLGMLMLEPKEKKYDGKELCLFMWHRTDECALFVSIAKKYRITASIGEELRAYCGRYHNDPPMFEIYYVSPIYIFGEDCDRDFSAIWEEFDALRKPA